MEIVDDVDEPTIEENKLKLTRAQFDDLVWMNHGRMKAEIARQVWGSEYFYPIVNDYFNETLNEAMKLWGEVEQLEQFAQRQAQLMRNQRN